MFLNNSMKSLIDCLLNFFYPRLCHVCGELLVGGENLFCMGCLYHLPRTGYHKNRDNPVAELFWGRVRVVAATAFFLYEKGSVYQDLIHKMKYKGYREIGTVLGMYLGADLKESDGFSSVDCIIPVPLHPKKERKRGYNQSEWIARGIAKSMGKPMQVGNLVRISESSTQTRKSRIERWENVQRIFAVRYPERIAGKHVLLVDDVVTTGATLEACSSVLLETEGVRVSIATLAVA